jgi:uncharacterized protein YjdB
MASVLLPCTPEIQLSATGAGFQTFLANATTLDVYSGDAAALQSWATTNGVTTPLMSHQMTSRMVHNLSPNAANVPYFTMTQLRAIYNYPAPITSNYVVGVVSFGGGLYGTVDSHGVLTNGDVQAYWTSIGIAPANQPKVIIVPINGATNSPNVNDGGLTMENTLDVEAIGGACPSANLTIIMYISPNTLDQFPTLLQYMYSTNVTVNGVNYKPNLISCSWGAPEIYYGSVLLSSIHSILSTMAAAGINMCVATGDNGSNDGVGGTGNYVDFPSSNPYATAVGGTSMVCPNYVYDGSTRETAWSTGGGGVSTTYAKPAYQSALSVAGRSIPDVSAVADPNTGVVFTVNGQPTVIGGTSVAAPTFAGFLASINCKTFINPLLYQASASCFHDIISGSNGSFTARSGYDSCTGLGSINGVNLATFLSAPTGPTGPILVSGITLSSATLSLLPAQSAQLTATIVPANAANQAITWSSSNSSVATVSNGLVTGVAVGSATITSTSTDGSNRSATALVTVAATPITPVSGITLNVPSATLHPTNTLSLIATVAPSNATNKTVTWTSSSANATVSASGVVTAVSAGSATITAACGGYSATCVVTITVSVASVTLSFTSFVLNTGTTKTLTATVLPSNATNKSVTWSSANGSIATVSASGVVTAVSAGSTTIQARTVDMGLTASSAVTVVVGVQSVSLSSTSISLIKGNTFQAVATVTPSNAANKTISWSSAMSSVATVSNTGLITAVGNGTGIISVFTQDGNKSASMIVRVTTAVRSVRLNQTSVSLARNATASLTASLSPSTASNQSVSWSSSNSAIVSVSSLGVIRGLAIGTAVVTVRTVDGNFLATCTVTVRA